MAPTTDISKPDDPFTLVGASWPSESESAYHSAKMVADDASTATSIQSLSASDAAAKMVDERGETAGAVGGGYGAAAGQLSEQSIHYNTVSAWMSDAEGKVTTAKRHIRQLVRAGTSEIRDALTSEVSGTAVTPSSADLITKYQGEIAQVASKLGVDLDAIGHSLAGAPGASRTPSYVSISTKPTAERPDPHISAASYTGDHHAPEVEPHQLPEMPRATTAEHAESPSTPSSPTSPHAVNPTLANLVGSGGQSTGTPSSPSAKSPSAPTSGTPAGQGAQAQQPNEQHQATKSPVLPRIPSVALPNIPAAAESIATAVSSATASPLPTAPTSPGSAQAPASTGLTPGTSGATPVTPAPPVGLAPIGSLPTPSPVVQTPPAPQGAPGTPQAGPQAPSAPQQSPVRGPAADLGWIQRTYGLAPGVELPKSEAPVIPALFIAELPDSEAHLHRVLASLRQAFEDAGWGQPMTVARIKRGLETRTVYATSDGLSIWPQGVQLPSEALPLDEMPGTPIAPELLGSVMVSEKLVAMIPREWTVEGVLSSVSGEEGSQSTEQYQALVSAGELLDCKVSRGREGVTDDEALSTFARASIGSTGVGELDVESARIRASRWVGTQPRGYLDTLARYYLSDAAESMSRGNWGEAVYSSEKYLSVQQSEKQAA
ncbi:Uncharacterised protein [Mycobacteroides abscessus subsp. abscessus]|nr:Uncharacterised protein [Mycobacteroides abscessus subsp. abscessus]